MSALSRKQEYALASFFIFIILLTGYFAYFYEPQCGSRTFRYPCRQQNATIEAPITHGQDTAKSFYPALSIAGMVLFILTIAPDIVKIFPKRKEKGAP